MIHLVLVLVFIVGVVIIAWLVRRIVMKLDCCAASVIPEPDFPVRVVLLGDLLVCESGEVWTWYRASHFLADECGDEPQRVKRVLSEGRRWFLYSYAGSFPFGYMEVVK